MHPGALAASRTLRGVRGIGDRPFKTLVDGFGSAAAVLGASAAELQDRGRVAADLANRIRAARTSPAAAAETAQGAALGLGVVAYGEARYPQPLREIANPPVVLYLGGEVTQGDSLAVASVGSRKASTRGARFAGKLARDLATAGVTVVSGLAQGIDAAAHRGALEGGGRTLAAFGAAST